MTVYIKKDPQSIQKMFDSIAKRYDLTNGILSFQMHRLWNGNLRRAAYREEQGAILDLCSGTGDIILPYLKQRATPCKAVLLDLSDEMLHVARYKGKGAPFEQHQIEFIQGDTLALPFENGSFDAVTIAYGIRNVASPEQCISEAYRVLRPNGTFGILELTQPNNGLLKFLHTIYLTRVLPVLGRMFTSNRDAYEYLCNSIQSFIPAERLEIIMRDQGFVNIASRKQMGGIATIITGSHP